MQRVGDMRGAAVDLLNAILPYAMAGAFFFWLIAEDREGTRPLGFWDSFRR